MRLKRYSLLYIPSCCSKPCKHPKVENTYETDLLSEALAAQERVGGKIFEREGEEMKEYGTT